MRTIRLWTLITLPGMDDDYDESEELTSSWKAMLLGNLKTHGSITRLGVASVNSVQEIEDIFNAAPQI